MLESFHFGAVVLKDKPDEIGQDQNMQRPWVFLVLVQEGSKEKQDILFSFIYETQNPVKACT